MGEPARGYSWPPFAPGHLKSLRHGARSERVIEATVAEHRDERMTAAPWLDDPAFSDAVRAYERAEARCQLLSAWLAKKAAEGGVEAVSADWWKRLDSTERLAADLRGRLGLDPATGSRIAKDVAIGGHFARGIHAAERDAALADSERRAIEAAERLGRASA